jgi:hypothetical protein
MRIPRPTGTAELCQRDCDPCAFLRTHGRSCGGSEVHHCERHNRRGRPGRKHIRKPGDRQRRSHVVEAQQRGNRTKRGQARRDRVEPVLRGKIFYADVAADGTVYASRGTSTTNATVPLAYNVVFDRDVGSCAWIVSRATDPGVGDWNPSVQLTAFGLKSFGQDPNTVQVRADTVNGTSRQPFSLLVVC